jgi:hypothetical protein
MEEKFLIVFLIDSIYYPTENINDLFENGYLVLWCHFQKDKMAGNENIFFKRGNVEYMKISSYENDNIPKEIRQIIFDYFMEKGWHILDFVKYEKRTFNLCLKHCISSCMNIVEDLVQKKYLNLAFIKKISVESTDIVGVVSFGNKTKLKRNLSYHYF